MYHLIVLLCAFYGLLVGLEKTGQEKLHGSVTQLYIPSREHGVGFDNKQWSGLNMDHKQCMFLVAKLTTVVIINIISI